MCLQLPKAIQSYYSGPQEKGYEPVDLEAEYKPPPPSSQYANVASRTSHVRIAEPPPPELHTSLEHGLTSVDPLLTGTGRSRSARRGSTQRASQSARRSHALTQSTPDFSFRTAGTASSRLQLRGQADDAAAPGDADTKKAEESSDTRSSTPSLTRSLTRLRAQQGSVSGTPAANAKERTPTERFVGEVAKMMARVRAGQTLLEKIAAAAAPPNTGPSALPCSAMQPMPAAQNAGGNAGGNAAARSMRRSTLGAAAAVAEQRAVQVRSTKLIFVACVRCC